MISVLMSVYNGEKFLCRAVNSVLNQTLTDFEFVIVNDGSTDRSKKILSDVELKDTRLKVFHIENKGLANALNFGINRCKRKFVARIDVDDIWYSTKLEDQLNFMIKNELDLSCTGFYTETKSSRKKYKPSFKNSSELYTQLWKFRPLVAHSSLMYSKQKIKNIGGYNAFFKTAEDFDLLIRASKALKCGSISKPLVDISKHEESISSEAGDLEQLSDALLSLAFNEGLIKPPILNSSHSSRARSFREIELKRISSSIFGKVWKYSNVKGSSYFCKMVAQIFRVLKYLVHNNTKRLLKRLYYENIS